MNLQEILQQHAAWLDDEGGGERADLRDADLRDADLSDADLRGADLRGADLRDADLRDADLSDADLRDADLSDADLRGADLRDADLRGADLRDADLRDADLSDADLRDADLSGTGLCVFYGTRYPVYVCKGMARIGCQYRTIADFLALSDDEAVKMGALREELPMYRAFLECAAKLEKTEEVTT